jgi:hypothetical protein
MLQLYHGQTKLLFNEMKMRSALYIDQHTSSLKQQFTDRHVAPMGHLLSPLKPSLKEIVLEASLEKLYWWHRWRNCIGRHHELLHPYEISVSELMIDMLSI